MSGDVATLGLSLFVLGLALGPLIWAPLSELYGRKSIYVISFMGFTAFSVAATCSPNIQSLLILRFFTSAFGSSSMTSTGGVIADMFSKEDPGMPRRDCLSRLLFWGLHLVGYLVVVGAVLPYGTAFLPFLPLYLHCTLANSCFFLL